MLLIIRKFQTHLGFVNEHIRVLFQRMCFSPHPGFKITTSTGDNNKMGHIGTYSKTTCYRKLRNLLSPYTK